LLFFGCAILLIPSGAPAQLRHPVTGRVIAPVMGVGGASWLVRPEREAEENPSKAVNLLGLQPGQTVADVGAGVGYWSFLLASQVGRQGKVFATDIQPEMLRLLRKRIEKAGVTNIETVLGSETGTGLPDGSADMVLLVDVYHEFSQPQQMLRSIRRTLKADGRLVLLEFRKEDPNVPIREEHKMSVEMVKSELEPEGFKLRKVLPDLPWQHIFFFTKEGAN
jgi:ubiquinone/menaquinone biosynthesis C-methylase UbiE